MAAANHPYVRRRLREAEGVFIAGGNQNDYATFWKNSAVDSALNYLINVKKVPIGGTSAGMAIQGQAYYTAAMGSITSPVALSNPYGSMVTIGNNDFLKHKLLRRVITDTHYDNPDRRGRQTAFLARLFQDSAIAFYGLACDEYTAICIDSTGMAKVFGGFPTYDDNAYFIQPNCILPNQPETCNSSQPLTWNRSNAALKVYAVKGTSVGVTAFNIKNWTNPSAAGGSWQNWYVNSGVLTTTATTNGINCITTTMSSNRMDTDFTMFPNPTNGELSLGSVQPGQELTIVNLQGIVIYKQLVQIENQKIDLSVLAEGIYFAMISGKSEVKKLVMLSH
jgi:cyanophycinase-like exopeptidase